MRRALLGALGALLVLATEPHAQAPAAQDPPPQPPTFRTGVGAVRVDVTVLDDDGRPVEDLTRDDFEVREDGVVQEISVFERLRLSGDPPAGNDTSLVIRSADHARQEAAREDVRLLVIFIDDYHLAYGALENARLRRELVEFVQNEVRPLDLVAVMGPLTPLSDLRLTRDSALLIERINELEGRLGGFVPPRSAIEQAHLQFGAGDLGRIRAQVTLSALQSLAVHLGGLRDGRKSILFVSQGPPTRVGGLELFTDLQAIIAAANRSNVVIHTLDPRQLGSARHASAANEALAADTGGRRIGLLNNFSKALKGVMADASHYYLLGFESSQAGTDGRFHRLAVRVARRGVRIIARSGYWAPRPEEVATAALAAAAATVPPEVGLALDELEEQARREVVADWMGLGPAGPEGTSITLAFEALGPRDRLRARSVHVEVTGPDGETFTRAPLESRRGVWLDRFTAARGRHRFRLTVRDAAGESLDDWSRELTVPGTGPSGSRVGTPVLFRPLLPAEFRALMAGDAVPPTAVRRLRRTERAVVRLPFDGSPVPPVEADLLNRSGDKLSSLPVTALDAPAAVQVELPLGGLAQADYLLRFRVNGGDPTTRLLAFTLAP